MWVVLVPPQHREQTLLKRRRVLRSLNPPASFCCSERSFTIKALQKQLKRIVVLAVGWAFILLGIAGLFLPILQGVLFLLIGLLILSSEYVWAHNLLQKLRARFPKISEHLDHARTKAERWVKRAP
jgi:hypothetical protein